MTQALCTCRSQHQTVSRVTSRANQKEPSNENRTIHVSWQKKMAGQVKSKLSTNAWAVMVPTLSKGPLAALHIPPKNEYKEVPIRIRGVPSYCIDNNDITS